MKIIVTAPTQIGGMWYEPTIAPQAVPDNIGEHLVQIGSATPFETKVVEPSEKKGNTAKKSSSASQADPALLKKTPAKRKGRPRKS